MTAIDPTASTRFSLTTSQVRSELADVSTSEYPGSLRQPRHGHDAAYITLVESGGYDERIGRTGTEVVSGRLIFHPSGEEHAVAFRAPLTRVVRLLPRGPALEAARLLGLDLSTAVPRPDRIAPLMHRLAGEARRGEPDALLALDALTSEALATLAGAGGLEPGGARIARRVRERIDADPAAPMRLATLAREAGCHPITLARAFRRATGTSLTTYVRRARLRLACSLLARRAMPIAIIAATCGFADQAHLTRALRRATGTTPARVR